jgi:hypothetical protein
MPSPTAASKSPVLERRRARFAGFVFIASLIVPLTARADDPSYGLPAPRLVPELSLAKDKGVESAQENSWATRKKQVSLMGGSPGSPLGVVAASFEYAPTKYTVLGAGGGWAPDGGLRGSFMPRLRLPLNRWFAVGLGFPVTLGPYEYSERVPELCQEAGCSTGYRTTRSWNLAFWGQIEPNVEFRLGNSGVALRVFTGFAAVLNDDDRCTSTLTKGCPSQIGDRKWYGGLAAGYAW